MKKHLLLLLTAVLFFVTGTSAAENGANAFIGRWVTTAYGTKMWVDFSDTHIKISIPEASDEYTSVISYQICSDGQVMLEQNGNSHFTTPEMISESEMIFDGMHLIRENAGNIVFEVAANGDGTVEITGCVGVADPLIIPETINGQMVTGIASRAFASAVFSQVQIPGSIAYIGDEAFEGSSLASLELPYGVQYIGQDIVKNCASLTVLRLPQSLKQENIMPQDFSACHDSLTVYLPGENNMEEDWMAAYPQTTVETYMSYAGTWFGWNHEGEEVTLILRENGSATKQISYANDYKFEYQYTWKETENGIVLYGAATVELEYAPMCIR